jgi:hypothetical protein
VLDNRIVVVAGAEVAAGNWHQMFVVAVVVDDYTYRDTFFNALKWPVLKLWSTCERGDAANAASGSLLGPLAHFTRAVYTLYE